MWRPHDIDGLGQDYSNSTANALELLQSCTKPFYQTPTNFWYVSSLCFGRKGNDIELNYENTNNNISVAL